MQLQLIRSATMRIEYAGHRFVTDPYLAARHSLPSYAGVSPNPLVDLPISAQEVIGGIEMALISHLHSDHFDPSARSLLPKATPILCQPGDEIRLAGWGFQDVTPIMGSQRWNDINLTHIAGQHGTGSVLQDMGHAAGFVLTAPGEPSVYWAGDTIWCAAVADAIATHHPDIIITHSSGAVWGEHVLILMDAAQTVQVCKSAPGSSVVAVHLDSLDHGTVTRQSLRAYAEANGIRPAQLRIPADGETLHFEAA